MTSHFEWLLSRHGQTLHYVPGVTVETWEFWDGTSPDQSMRASCGRWIYPVMPGAISRLHAKRCRYCCQVLGIKEGNGTPRNEAP